MMKERKLMNLINEEGTTAELQYKNGTFLAECSDGKIITGFKTVMELIDSMKSRGFKVA